MSLLFIFIVLYAIFVVISVGSFVIPVISVISVNRHTGTTVFTVGRNTFPRQQGLEKEGM